MPNRRSVYNDRMKNEVAPAIDVVRVITNRVVNQLQIITGAVELGYRGVAIIAVDNAIFDLGRLRDDLAKDDNTVH